MNNSAGKKYLIVNAYDYGMTLSISRGILKCAEGGLVKSTTVMTNSHDFNLVMDEILSASVKLDIGFHANLTWGQPESEPEEIRTLVNSDGLFHSRACLLKKACLGMISYDEVYRELKKQYLKLAERVQKITHIDGHHHVHAFPIVRNAIEKIANEFGVLFIRSPYEGSWSSWYWAGARRFAIAMLDGSRPKYWKRRGFKTSDNFAGFALSAGEDIDSRWLKTLMNLKEGVTEIMVHPGHFSPSNDRYNVEREEEMRVLTNSSLINSAKELSVEIISFADL